MEDRHLMTSSSSDSFVDYINLNQLLLSLVVCFVIILIVFKLFNYHKTPTNSERSDRVDMHPESKGPANIKEETRMPKPADICEKNAKEKSTKGDPPTNGHSPSPPGIPTVEQLNNFQIRVKWMSPTFNEKKIRLVKYKIQCLIRDASLTSLTHPTESEEWEDIMNVPAGTLYADIEARNNHTYFFCVAAVYGELNHAQSAYGPISDAFIFKISPSDLMKENIRKMSKQVKDDSPSIYALQLNEVVKNDEERIHKYQVGQKSTLGISEKVIMVVGATGAGKTTLINGLVNYIFGVNWDDPFRFKLVHEEFKTSQAMSQTSNITSYTIHHQQAFQIPYTLTIIDTPGFGDTGGITRDKEITKQIHAFFSTTGVGGIDHIDAIGFVAQASLARLTPTQKYVFDSILSLFGKDIADNIFILVTFADGQKPPLMAGIEAAKLPYKGFFKFNNSALFAQNKNITSNNDEIDEDEGGFDKMFWDMGFKSFKFFLKKLAFIEGRSLILTKGVLDERSHIEAYILGIQQGINTGLNKLEQLREENQVLTQHQADIDANKDFTYTVTEEVVECNEIESGTYITNCLPCNRTCHYPCGIPDDADKRGCAAMTNGKCTVCPGKCDWKVHKNMAYKIDIIQKEVTKQALDLKKRYEDAQGKKLSAEQIINAIADEFDDVQFEVLHLTEEVRKSVNKLQEIALVPNPLSSVEYIDILIQTTKDEAKPGWKKNLQHLQTLRKDAEIMMKVTMDGYDPFQDYKDVELRLPTKQKGGKLKRFKNWLGF